jgi:deazaflavin-dependent oxidoreductase (nitroreductase family)
MVFMDDLSTLATEPFCYLTTIGRSSGRPHTIEIWFALHGTTMYLLSGGGENSDWVKNLQRNPAIQVRIGTGRFTGRARVLDGSAEEEDLARRVVTEKYQPGYAGDLSRWREASLPVAIDLGRLEPDPLRIGKAFGRRVPQGHGPRQLPGRGNRHGRPWPAWSHRPAAGD